jgi:hypothetical protein
MRFVISTVFLAIQAVAGRYLNILPLARFGF